MMIARSPSMSDDIRVVSVSQLRYMDGMYPAAGRTTRRLVFRQMTRLLMGVVPFGFKVVAVSGKVLPSELVGWKRFELTGLLVEEL